MGRPKDYEHAFIVLGLPKGATAKEIKESYREMIRVWHPDKHAGDVKLSLRADAELKRINEAYEAALKFAKIYGTTERKKSRTPAPPQKPPPPPRQPRAKQSEPRSKSEDAEPESMHRGPSTHGASTSKNIIPDAGNGPGPVTVALAIGAICALWLTAVELNEIFTRSSNSTGRQIMTPAIPEPSLPLQPAPRPPEQIPISPQRDTPGTPDLTALQ